MAVTVSMASCSLEEVVEQPTPQAIGFSSFVGKPTKAVTQTEKTNLGSFQVYGGYETNTSVFEGVSVTSADRGSSWSYTNTQYWVPSQTYRFAAVGPSSAVSTANFTYEGTGGHNGYLTFDYSLVDLTNSVDVVYAESGDKTTPATITEQDPSAVEFTFGHIMSWIKIKFVHNMTDDYKITVSDVKVGGVQTNATFTGSDVSTGGWTAPNTPAYLGTSDASVVQPDIFEGGATASPLDADGESCSVDFIAIPQTISGSSFVISFKLKVQDATGSYLVGSDAGGVNFSTTLTEQQEWKINNIYVYTANLTSGVLGLQPIKFSVKEVGGWGNTNTPTTPNPSQVP